MLIEQLVDSPVLSHTLTDLVDLLRLKSNLQFYTDGSLQHNSSLLDTMGLGWVVQHHEDIEFAASAILWPSSTKTEVLACLTALLVAPVKAKVTINTDSAATIAGFDKLVALKHLSVQKREKIPNFQIWMAIAHIIESKFLQTTLVKIKAHSGDRLNDRADRIAKTAAYSAPHLNINYLAIPSLKLEITCDNLTLEASSRKSIKAICEARHFSLFLLLHRNADINLLTEHHHINWSATSFMLNSNTFETDKGNTSFAQYRQRSFKYKIFSDELPTLSRLKRRRPDLYPSDTCLSCSQSSETQLHFWSCPSHQAQWINTLNRAADLLMQLF